MVANLKSGLSGCVVAFSLLFLITMLGCETNAEAMDHPAIPSGGAVQMQDFLGVNVAFQLYDSADYEKQIAALQKLGVKWIRMGLHWFMLEPSPGKREYDKLDTIMAAVKNAGLKCVVNVVGPPAHQSAGGTTVDRPDQYPPADYAVYGDLLIDLAKRYPQVTAWQIWNEPNLRMFWQPDDQPDEYSAMVKVVTDKLRKAVPDRTLVLGGMAYWSIMLKSEKLMLKEPSMENSFEWVDAVAYHPFLSTPYGDSDTNNPYNFITTGLWLNDTLRNLGARQIWATEWGWGSYKTHKLNDELVNETDQATFILQRIALMMAMGYEKIFYFSIADLPDLVPLPHRDMGLLDINGNPKPSYTALARFLELFRGRLSPISPPSSDGIPKNVWQFAWQSDSGKKLWIIWADAVTSVKLTDISSPVVQHNPLSGEVKSLTPKDHALELSIGLAPLIFELN